MLQILFFSILSGLVFYIAYGRFLQIYKNISLGITENEKHNSITGLKNMILFALGQKKMFNKPVSGIFHLFIYLAFALTQIELLEILMDGFTGEHRIFAHALGSFYNFLINSIEILSFLAFISTFIFLYRRNILKLIRFQKPEMKGWPSLDANLILMGEILLIAGIFVMNSSDQILQNLDPQHYPSTGKLYISSFIGASLLGQFPQDWLIWLERMGWWLHLFVIYGFILYLPFSKHLHIFLAFPNAYLSNQDSRGKMSNIPVIENEARSMVGLSPKEIQDQTEIFGAADIFHLTKRTLIGAYSCTECGRCTAVCPANLTGKKLSPRKIVMDIRDRMEEISKQPKPNGECNDGKNLFDYISREEIYACTSCNACVEACPVLINPLEPILALRRYDILMNSGGPSEWMSMFNSLENTQSVWQIPETRDSWTKS
ncbi:MAG: (Fe-S)-binding protein [Saprospiraceae bacterium]|nr:(Fe-S)-binding protein [Saprospiraceae bacterium]